MQDSGIKYPNLAKPAARDLYFVKNFPLTHRRCGKTVSKLTISVQEKQEIVGLETKDGSRRL